MNVRFFRYIYFFIGVTEASTFFIINFSVTYPFRSIKYINNNWKW